MPQSLSRLYIHLVFSTKNRTPNLSPGVRNQLYPYMGGVLRNLGSDVVQIGGVEDHVHLLLQLSRVTAMADLVKELKVSTSKWMKTSVPDFSWQSGYGAFSVSGGELDHVVEYIRTQEEHHRHRTFQEEYREILISLGIEFDERFVWD